MKPIKILQYKWAGSWGPFRVKVLCDECDLTETTIKSVLEKEYANRDIAFETLPWLDNWYKVIWKGGWHAPIVLINGKVISQGEFLPADKFREELEKILQ